VAKLAHEIPEPKIDQGEVKRRRKWTLAPLSGEKGLDPYDAISRIQQAVIPVKYTLIRDGSRLKEALGIVEEVRDGILPKVRAVDPHYLVKYHEAASMTLCTEMLFRASLYRTESRASFVREDYPERDDENWLRWTIIKREGEKMALSTEPVPLAKYKFKPEGYIG
jgi:succinate dehydrogenase/fumarate reductase flavoprotein subunit